MVTNDGQVHSIGSIPGALGELMIDPGRLPLGIGELPWRGLDEDDSQPNFHHLLGLWKEGGEVYPAQDQVFEAFRLTPLEAVKVVIVGQDPYPNPDQATGLAFSVPPDLRPLPASLRNIHKAMREDGFNPPEHGDLTHWAKQGVLLLNTALTVPRGKPGAHVRAWRPFTKAVIGRLNSRPEPVVFVLWGVKAQKLTKLITAPPQRIITAPHPAARGAAQKRFRESRTFSTVNQELARLGQQQIEWASA